MKEEVMVVVVVVVVVEEEELQWLTLQRLSKPSC